MERPGVPAADPGAAVRVRRAAIDAAIARVLDRGRYILGEEVAAFEGEFASALGHAHAVGVGSGTDALELALVAAGVRRGDEVITVAHTAVATVAAIERAGAIPVLVDIEPLTMVLDPALLEAACTPRTRAVVPVHLYGQAADLLAILAIARARGLLVVEDCAQAHGARLGGRALGTFGDAAAYSFYPTKNLGALGDAGMVTTGSAEVAGRVLRLREYGWRERNVSLVPGWNSRLDELQAAILRVRLRDLSADNERRRAIAARYDAALAGTQLQAPAVRPGAYHVYHQYVVRHPRRDALRASLKECGIGTLVHYPAPVHRQPAYQGRVRVVAGLKAPPGTLPESEAAAAEVVSLPVHPELTDAQVDAVIDGLGAFVGTRSR